MEAGLAFAFAGGVLGLFSPCNAMLLPAFFAHAATSGRRLWALGLAFLAGMLATLVPLGLGIGWLGGAVSIDRRLLVVVAAWVIVLLGVVQILGGGFDLSRLLPSRLRRRGGASASPWGAVLLGTVAGVAGFCTGPVLGAILTLVLANGSIAGGGLLLASYALGMVLPVLAVAAAMRRAGGFRAGWLRGRTVQVGRFRLHTNPLVAGTVTVIVGSIMLATGGLVTMPELLSADVMDRISGIAGRIDDAVPGWVWPTVLGAVLLAWWIRLVGRRLKAADAPGSAAELPDSAPVADRTPIGSGARVPAKGRP